MCRILSQTFLYIGQARALFVYISKSLGYIWGLVLDASCHLRTAVPSYNENDEIRVINISPGLSFDASLLGPQLCGGSCTIAQTPCVRRRSDSHVSPRNDRFLWCSFSSGMRCREIELMRIRISHITHRSPLPSWHGTAQISA